MPETIAWVDADGMAHQLNDPTEVVSLLRGMSNRFVPPVEIDEDTVPLQPGTRVRQVRHDAREIPVPLLLREADETALRTTLRTWARRLDPLRGDGRLRVTGPGGDTRELTCRYLSGLEIEEEQGFFPAARQKAVIVLRAGDPYWYDTADTAELFTLTGEPAPFFPFFPLRLSASTIAGDFNVDNVGDVDAWPVWTVTGPGEDLVLTNLTTGKALTLETTLGAGETIVIDTRPGHKTVVRVDDAANMYPALTSTSSLWPLAKSINAIRVELSDATGDSSVQLNRRHRHLTC